MVKLLKKRYWSTQYQREKDDVMVGVSLRRAMGSKMVLEAIVAFSVTPM